MNVNPDNVATPIAASLGDLVTLAILAYTSSAIYDLSTDYNVSVDEHSLDALDYAFLDAVQSYGVNFGTLSCITLLLLYYAAIAPSCFIRAKKNKETEVVLLEGWTPGNVCSLLL